MAIRGLDFEDKPMWVRLPRLPPKQRPQVNLAAFVILYRDIGAENMDVVMTIVRCAPISFQLAGALVVICVLSLSGSIDDVLNHTKVIATIPNEDSSRIYINKDISKMSVEKNCEQFFSSVYIIIGYLSAVLAGSYTPSGLEDMVTVALISAVLWGVAKTVSTFIAKHYADHFRSIQRGEKTKGVVAYKKVED